MESGHITSTTPVALRVGKVGGVAQAVALPSEGGSGWTTGSRLALNGGTCPM